MEGTVFWNAWEEALCVQGSEHGIGTLSEKRLHAALKRCYAPTPASTEIPIGNYVADVFDGERIVEIQTRAFRTLARKLEAFLPLYPVHVVCPIPRAKYSVWVDPETGEVLSRRRTQKQAKPLQLFHELYALTPYLQNERLSIELLSIDMEEHRLLDGRGKDRKKGATKLERIPLSVPESVFLRTETDYRALLPKELPERFTVSRFGKETHLAGKAKYSAVHVLEAVGVLVKDGMEGRAQAYRLVKRGENR